jgi:hypothetical protein
LAKQLTVDKTSISDHSISLCEIRNPPFPENVSSGDQPMNDSCNRRDFLKTGSVLSAGAVLAGATGGGCSAMRRTMVRTKARSDDFCVPPIDPVRIGYVGIGGMGTGHVNNLLKIEGAQIRAVCDIVPEKVEHIQQKVEDAGQARPAGYSRGVRDFVRMCETEELDLVYTATPWEWHVPVCVAAMKTGKHAATEVPAAVTLDECWELVETAEKHNKHCVMMENCCYDRVELMILNMVRQGLLGELQHGQGGYMHDLRATNSIPPRAKGCGGQRIRSGATATCIRHTAWGRSPSA